jgi:hypothetical protein
MNLLQDEDIYLASAHRYLEIDCPSHKEHDVWHRVLTMLSHHFTLFPDHSMPIDRGAIKNTNGIIIQDNLVTMLLQNLCKMKYKRGAYSILTDIKEYGFRLIVKFIFLSAAMFSITPLSASFHASLSDLLEKFGIPAQSLLIRALLSGGFGANFYVPLFSVFFSEILLKNLIGLTNNTTDSGLSIENRFRSIFDSNSSHLQDVETIILGIQEAFDIPSAKLNEIVKKTKKSDDDVSIKGIVVREIFLPLSFGLLYFNGGVWCSASLLFGCNIGSIVGYFLSSSLNDEEANYLDDAVAGAQLHGNDDRGAAGSNIRFEQSNTSGFFRNITSNSRRDFLDYPIMSSEWPWVARFSVQLSKDLNDKYDLPVYKECVSKRWDQVLHYDYI